MNLKLNLIAAACDNLGIGINGDLPWRLKNEMEFFTRMTTTTADDSKENLVLMGRRTWECIPKKFKPLKNRINMVMSRRAQNYGERVLTCTGLPHAYEIISQPPWRDKVETIWVIGGSSVYKLAMESANCHRLYLTRIYKEFECDTYFPAIPANWKLIQDPMVPAARQYENGLEYEYQVYQGDFIV